MKILELRIENFGKFHDFIYRFNGSGIEILNGENEFGKTTLITFIQRILYGFPDKRKAENMYESSAEPYGGSLRCIANDGRHITIERLKSGKNKTFRIYDTHNGEELNAADYIRQGADFYRNIYMIHLKDLLDESSLDNAEIHHHLYGLERAFGAVSPLKVREILEKNCNSLYRPKGSTQDIPKLSKELKSMENELNGLETEINSLSAHCAGAEDIAENIKSLNTQISVLEKINSLKEKHSELLNSSNQEYDGDMPDKFIFSKQEKINSLAESRTAIAADAKREIQLNEEIASFEQSISKLEFKSIEEFEKRFAEYQSLKQARSEQLLRNEIAKEEYQKNLVSAQQKRKILIAVSAFLLISGIILLIFKIAPWTFILLPLAIIAYFMCAVKNFESAPLPDIEDKEQYFAQQKALFDYKEKLHKNQSEVASIQEKYNSFLTELAPFKEYFSAPISRTCEAEIKLLREKLDTVVRNDIQYELFRKNTEKAKIEADALFTQILQIQNDNKNINGTLENLKENLAECTRKQNETALLQQQLKQKTETFNNLQIKYQSGKKTFNSLIAEYLKWKNALTLWDSTIAVFEAERQGEVIQTASKYFAELTSNAYPAVRNSIVSGDGLVAFDGQNNKTVDKLSSGTREQLLFVLRLALIEYIEKNSPANISMPLLMDDIFVNYDETREQNAWKILEDFSQKRQIIFCRAKNRV